MSDDLEHLTEEQRKTILEIYPKEIKDLEASVSEDSKNIPEKEKGLNKKSEEQKEDWKSGYLEYEVKTKESDRVVYDDDEIDITEEDLD